MPYLRPTSFFTTVSICGCTKNTPLEYLEADVKNFAAILDFFTICATMNNKGMAAIELIKTVGLVEVYTPK